MLVYLGVAYFLWYRTVKQKHGFVGSYSDTLYIGDQCGTFTYMDSCLLRQINTWRIIPFSKWLVTPICKPLRPFGRGVALLRGLTITMVINHLLTGMILQVVIGGKYSIDWSYGDSGWFSNFLLRGDLCSTLRESRFSSTSVCWVQNFTTFFSLYCHFGGSPCLFDWEGSLFEMLALCQYSETKSLLGCPWNLVTIVIASWFFHLFTGLTTYIYIDLYIYMIIYMGL